MRSPTPCIACRCRQLVPDVRIEADAIDVDALAAHLRPELVQLWYQMALNGRRDLSLAPSARAGFEMAMLRMLAFRPSSMPTQQPASAGEASRAAAASAKAALAIPAAPFRAASAKRPAPNPVAPPPSRRRRRRRWRRLPSTPSSAMTQDLDAERWLEPRRRQPAARSRARTRHARRVRRLRRGRAAPVAVAADEHLKAPGLVKQLANRCAGARWCTADQVRSGRAERARRCTSAARASRMRARSRPSRFHVRCRRAAADQPARRGGCTRFDPAAGRLTSAVRHPLVIGRPQRGTSSHARKHRPTHAASPEDAGKHAARAGRTRGASKSPAAPAAAW